MFPDNLVNLALIVSDDARAAGLRIATAESCTGGLLAGLFTSLAGSSHVFDRGFVTYSNRAKSEVLGIPADLIADTGAVSESVARLMAEAAIEHSRANIGVGITGIAGPGGGTRMKPVGTVHIACARENRAIRHEHKLFLTEDRDGVRLATLEVALEMIQEQITALG